jgi:hypothetical protein
LDKGISQKAKLIFLWIADDTQPLRRLTFIIRIGVRGKLSSGLLRPQAILK